MRSLLGFRRKNTNEGQTKRNNIQSHFLLSQFFSVPNIQSRENRMIINLARSISFSNSIYLDILARVSGATYVFLKRTKISVLKKNRNVSKYFSFNFLLITFNLFDIHPRSEGIGYSLIKINCIMGSPKQLNLFTINFK